MALQLNSAAMTAPILAAATFAAFVTAIHVASILIAILRLRRRPRNAVRPISPS